MGLLGEYAITPDVFDVNSYQTDEACGLHLRSLKEVLLDEGLVRNLCDGQWQEIFSAADRTWHNGGRELLRRLRGQGRLVAFPAMRSQLPTTDDEWCAEALASHRREALVGIIATRPVADTAADPAAVAIDRLGGASWWAGRGPSVRLRLCLADYLAVLQPVLCHAKSLIFIDPFLDPGHQAYAGFADLLRAASHEEPPLIELHRKAKEGRDLLRQEDLEPGFRTSLQPVATELGVPIHVYVWGDFHDRYLISNLVGISAQSGFATPRGQPDHTTWTRLSRTHRDDVQREFESGSSDRTLSFRFDIDP